MVVLKDQDASKANINEDGLELVKRLDYGIVTPKRVFGRWYYPNCPKQPFANDRIWYGPQIHTHAANLRALRGKSLDPIFHRRSRNLDPLANRYLTTQDDPPFFGANWADRSSSPLADPYLKSRPSSPLAISMAAIDSEQAPVNPIAADDQIIPQARPKPPGNSNDVIDAIGSPKIGGRETIRKLNFGSEIIGRTNNTARLLNFRSKAQRPDTFSRTDSFNNVRVTYQRLRFISPSYIEDPFTNAFQSNALAVREQAPLFPLQAQRRVKLTEEQFNEDFEHFVNQEMLKNQLNWVDHEGKDEDNARLEASKDDWSPTYQSMWEKENKRMPIPYLDAVQRHSLQQSMRSVFGEK